MYPTLKDGDIIIYKPIKKKFHELNQNSIVVAWDPNNLKELIIKRVHKINNYAIELRGDNQSKSIDSRHYGTIRKENIEGIVSKIISLN